MFRAGDDDGAARRPSISVRPPSKASERVLEPQHFCEQLAPPVDLPVARVARRLPLRHFGRGLSSWSHDAILHP
eukprot:6218589-Prymnesium_polylepis.1